MSNDYAQRMLEEFKNSLDLTISKTLNIERFKSVGVDRVLKPQLEVSYNSLVRQIAKPLGVRYYSNYNLRSVPDLPDMRYHKADILIEALMYLEDKLKEISAENKVRIKDLSLSDPMTGLGITYEQYIENRTTLVRTSRHENPEYILLLIEYVNKLYAKTQENVKSDQHTSSDKKEKDSTKNISPYTEKSLSESVIKWYKDKSKRA